MPRFLERRLKEEYGEKSAVPFKVMNAIGAMHGNKETAKGREMEKKHEEDKTMKKAPMGHMREMRIQIHRGPAPHHKVTGFTVHHQMMPRPASKSGAYMEHESHEQPFSSKEHAAMIDHVTDHLEGVMGKAAPAAESEEAEGE